MSVHANDNNKKRRKTSSESWPVRSSSSSVSWLVGLGWRNLSNLLLNNFDGFGLNGWRIAEARQPVHVRFPAKPCNLALGIIAMRLLRRGKRRLAIQFAAQELQRLFVSERAERARLIAIPCQQLFCLSD